MVHRKANRDANGISFLTDDSSDLAKNWSKKTLIIWPAINYLQNQKQLKRQKSALDIFNWHFEFYEQVKDCGGVKDGYAPFCKHLFIENFTDQKSSYAVISDENQ